MMAFTIVHFVETNTVEAVPLSWIISEGDDLICLWPTKGANRHIREQTPPDVSWQSFNIRRLGSKEYLTLEAAQSAADRSQYTSNIDSHDENDDESIVHLKHKKKSAIHTSSNKPGNKLLKKRRKTCFPTPPRKSCKRLQQCLQVRNIAHDSMPNKTVASNPDTSGTCMKDVSATETAFSVSLHVLSENECDDRTEDANENQNGVIASTNGFMNAETEVACNAIGCSLQEEGLPNHEKGSGSDAPISTINAVSNCVASSLACTTSTSSAVFSEIRKANEVSETSNYPGLLQPAGVGSGVGHSDHNDLRRQTHCRNILGHNSLQSVVAERPTAKPSDSSRTLVNSNQTRDLRTKTVACTGSSASSVNADGLHSKRSLNAGFDIDLPRKMIRRQSASQSLNKRVVRDTIGNNCYQDQTVSKEDNGSQRQPQSQFVPAASFRSSSKAKPSSVVEPAKSAFVHGAAGANREKQSMKQATVNCNQNRDHTRKGDVHSASPTQVSSMPSTSAASMNIRRLCERQCLDDGEGDYHRLTGVTPARVRKPACVTSNSTPRGTVASDRMPGLSSDRCIECGNETDKFHKTILYQLVQLKKQVAEIHRIIGRQCINEQHSADSINTEITKGPITSIDGYKSFIQSCSNEPSVRQAVFSILKNVGGSTVAENTRAVMSRTFSNYVMSFMSLQGRSLNKFKFRNTAVCGIVVDSVLYNHQTSTAAEVHKQIGVHLKLAPYREGGAGKGARVVDGNPSRTHSEVQVNEDESDDQGNNDRYAIESSLHGDDPLGSRDFLSGTDVDDVEI